MSNRSMLEFNHDYTPHGDAEKREFVDALVRYLGSANPRDLPRGVTFFKMRHHSDPCPLGDPPRGWGNDLPRKESA